MIVLRREIGDVLRAARQRQGRTLREVSSTARVSLGYLSEIERGQKEASSELLGSICEALDAPMSVVLREVSDRLAAAEGLAIPDTVPADLERSLRRGSSGWSPRGELSAPAAPARPAASRAGERTARRGWHVGHQKIGRSIGGRRAVPTAIGVPQRWQGRPTRPCTGGSRQS